MLVLFFLECQQCRTRWSASSLCDLCINGNPPEIEEAAAAIQPDSPQTPEIEGEKKFNTKLTSNYLYIHIVYYP